MIRSFSDRRTEQFYQGQRVSAFSGFANQASRRLAVLYAAMSLDDLRALRSNRLESLRGNRRGQYSIRINDQWRVCFKWDARQQEAYDVEIVDYH